MKPFLIVTAVIFTIYLVYVGFAFPTLNTEKAGELWGEGNKWIWYTQFCALHLLYALVPVSIAGAFFSSLRNSAATMNQSRQECPGRFQD